MFTGTSQRPLESRGNLRLSLLTMKSKHMATGPVALLIVILSSTAEREEAVELEAEGLQDVEHPTDEEDEGARSVEG